VMGHEHPSVLIFFGVGVVGKTPWCKKALSDFRIRLRQNIYNLTLPRIVEINLDSDSVTPNDLFPQSSNRSWLIHHPDKER
jgi:hypothetical protein